MIYLIGGAPRCGKTILSKALAKNVGCSWITTDALRSVILASTPASERRRKFPFTRLSGSEREKPETSMRAEITEAASMWPGIKALINQLIDCDQHYIIEGVHLLPKLVVEFRKSPHRKRIRVLYLVKEDPAEIRRGLFKETGEYDWLRSSLKDERVVENIVRMIRLKSAFIERQAKRRGFKVVNTDKGFSATIRRYSSPRFWATSWR